jgi:hypothetical protein
MISIVIQGNSVTEGLLQVTLQSLPSISATIHYGSIISTLNVL